MVLVATRSTSLREGLRALLAAITPDQTIEFVDDYVEVFRKLTQSPVDLVVLDADLSAVSARTALSQIKQVSSATRLLVLTDTVQQQHTVSPFEAEAVLLKGIAATEIASTIEHLLDASSSSTNSEHQSKETLS